MPRQPEAGLAEGLQERGMVWASADAGSRGVPFVVTDGERRVSTWGGIRTPDQRLRVFVSSTLAELAAERVAVRRAVERLRLTPVMFELGARPYPPRDLYRAYLAQSDLFIGVYWQSYGWVAPGEEVSGLEDEFRLSGSRPRLLYVREPAPDRHPRLEAMLEEVRQEGSAAYKVFSEPDELERLVADDLAVLLSERFQASLPPQSSPPGQTRSGAVIEPDNPIIGRDDELAAVMDLLASGTRIVTLTGPAGIGKSRLALELARLLVGRYPDGVWTVLLESLRDPALVMPTIAQVLGVRPGGHEEPLGGLERHLSDRRSLLVLDNFEQVTGAARDVADLLAGCPGVQIVVTSRTPLRIRGEHECPVHPLAVPDPDGASIATLRGSPAVRLFLACAKAVGALVALWDDELRTIARICSRLDGLPLAVEFAATRSRLLPPRELLQRLERRLPLLTGGARDAPQRHRTLRAAIDWGHDLLEPDERVALRRLSVFSGGWTLAAGEEVVVAAGPLARDTLDLMESLILQSFVVRSPLPGPEPRLTLLQTFREYGWEKLAASPDLDATSQAHAAYFLAFAEQAAPETHGPDQVTWLDALERDHDNLREALRWFTGRGDVEPQLRLTTALGRFWVVHCHFREALGWLERARDSSSGRKDRLRAEVLSWLGIVALAVGDVDVSEAAHTEALPIRQAVGDRHGEHIELLSLGNVAFAREDLDTAATRWQELARLSEEAGDDDLRARALANFAIVARQREDLHAARSALERAIQLHEARGEPHAAVIAKLNMSAVLLDLGDVSSAHELIATVLVQAQVLGDVVMALEGLEVTAAIKAAEGRPEDAGWLFGAAESFRQRFGAPHLGAEAETHEREVRRAREAAAQAGRTAEFEGAWRAGAAATFDEAVALALRGGPAERGAAGDLPSAYG